jgi:predicted anti-sigma-YlaC factor YlaD
MPVTCKEYRLALAAELDGEASAASVARREAHQARCPACEGFARRLLALRRTLHAWPDVEPSPGLTERALQRCTAAPRRKRRAPRWTVAAAVAAGCAALLLWVAPMVPRGDRDAVMSPEAAYALEALGRAGARVALARDRTGSILERVAEIQGLRRRQP